MEAHLVHLPAVRQLLEQPQHLAGVSLPLKRSQQAPAVKGHGWEAGVGWSVGGVGGAAPEPAKVQPSQSLSAKQDMLACEATLRYPQLAD